MKRKAWQARMILGDLTIFDFHDKIVKPKGGFQNLYNYYSIGKYWLPISYVRNTKDFFLIWQGAKSVPESYLEPEVKIPARTSVKVVGNLVLLNVDPNNLEDGCNGIPANAVELRIELDFAPFE